MVMGRGSDLGEIFQNRSLGGVAPPMRHFCCSAKECGEGDTNDNDPYREYHGAGALCADSPSSSPGVISFISPSLVMLKRGPSKRLSIIM